MLSSNIKASELYTNESAGMNTSVDTHLLGQIQADLKELRRTAGHLEHKVIEISKTVTGTDVKTTISSLKPLLALLVLQGFANIALLLKLVLR